MFLFFVAKGYKLKYVKLSQPPTHIKVHDRRKQCSKTFQPDYRALKDFRTFQLVATEHCVHQLQHLHHRTGKRPCLGWPWVLRGDANTYHKCFLSFLYCVCIVLLLYPSTPLPLIHLFFALSLPYRFCSCYFFHPSPPSPFFNPSTQGRHNNTPPPRGKAPQPRPLH